MTGEEAKRLCEELYGPLSDEEVARYLGVGHAHAPWHVP